jgi:acetyl esterase/lipase
MDLFYASIGKAIELTRGQQESQDTSPESTDTKSSNLWTYVVASLAASYYNVIGPAAKSSQVIQNARGAKSVIQNAWGVVSLPAIKRASLEATRILKGAAIADRIEIDGISCFVLSREPFPALTSALRRYRRQQQREDVRLGTIHEQLSLGHASVNVSGFVRRNVIFHLTGGGFYAHTIAGDLPYLLDWSAATDSVVIIPEYALLPEHKFPDAIAQITQLYRAVRCGQAATLLGFHANKIIVSGESAGGNLAAALCVTIIMDRDESEYVQLTPSKSMDLVTDQEESFEEEDEGEEPFGVPMNEGGIPLPDAVLLSCPALNLSLETSPSRLVGADDPVLPSGLIAAISNSYLPIDGEFHKTHPIASPYFASDETLSQFPPTLIFTSYEDPFLDDSVNCEFNS